MSQGRVQRLRLLGRRSECEALDQLLTDVLAGRSQVIVVRGEAGVGKSALLRYLSEKVTGWHVATAVGVESEMELAYSGLHQLCSPMLDHLDRLPVPQREALAIGTLDEQRTQPCPGISRGLDPLVLVLGLILPVEVQDRPNAAFDEVRDAVKLSSHGNDIHVGGVRPVRRHESLVLLAPRGCVTKGLTRRIELVHSDQRLVDVRWQRLFSETSQKLVQSLGERLQLVPHLVSEPLAELGIA
jgi:hypothetical protein